MNNFNTNVPRLTTEKGDNILFPFSPPIYQTEVDSKFTKEILEEGRKLTKKDDDFSPSLAGNLKYGRSYHYRKDYLLKVEPYLISKVENFFNGLYEQYGPNYSGVKKLLEVQRERKNRVAGKLILDSLWINFSKKHDNNPPHTHTGVLSFVLFLKVPQEIFEVQADSNNKKAGNLVFQCGEPISELMGNEFPVKPYENLMFIFPNNLKHHVPAYWVDAERISVSGNFMVI